MYGLKYRDLKQGNALETGDSGLEKDEGPSDGNSSERRRPDSGVLRVELTELEVYLSWEGWKDRPDWEGWKDRPD